MKEILTCTVLMLILIWMIKKCFTLRMRIFASFSNFPLVLLLIFYVFVLFIKRDSIPIRWEGIVLAVLITIVIFTFRLSKHLKEEKEQKYYEDHMTEFIDRELLKQLLTLNEQENIPHTERECLCTCPFGDILKTKQATGKKIDFETCIDFPQCFQYCNVFKCDILEMDGICKIFLDYDNSTPAKCKLSKIVEDAELQKLVNELTEEITTDRARFS